MSTGGWIECGEGDGEGAGEIVGEGADDPDGDALIISAFFRMV